jgi:hypothetical protein
MNDTANAELVGHAPRALITALSISPRLLRFGNGFLFPDSSPDPPISHHQTKQHMLAETMPLVLPDPLRGQGMVL